jgi:hypothetical protein
MPLPVLYCSTNDFRDPKTNGKCGSATNSLVNFTLKEQNIIWSHAYKAPDILISLGESISLNLDKLFSSMFYIELLRAPRLVEVGLLCQARIRCRLSPSQTAFMPLINRLRNYRARFTYQSQILPCVNEEAFEDGKRGIPFYRYIGFSVASIYDEVDVKIENMTKNAQSISNCPYELQTLIRDQGLDCVFGHKDHQRRY